MHKTLLALACVMTLFLAACQGRRESAESDVSSKEPAATEPATGGEALAKDEVACSDAGPQSPRDVDQVAGENVLPPEFVKAPPFAEMNLCDIHYHTFAEHKASGYPTLTGSGDHAGFACADHEPAEGAERRAAATCQETSLGDTVEVHWVFTSCDSEKRLGHSLDTCLEGCEGAPVLRVEGRVFYLTEDEDALKFKDFSNPDSVQVPSADAAVEYIGSTTGPRFNREGICSAPGVTWNVGTACSPLRLDSLDAWCADNVFEEHKAHGVRTLVTDLKLLSPIE